MSTWLVEGQDQSSSPLSLAAFSKCWLIIPLCTFVSEKGTWLLGSSQYSPEPESYGSRGFNTPSAGVPRGWTARYTILQGPPALMFLLFLWDPVLQGNFCNPADGAGGSPGTEWPRIPTRLCGAAAVRARSQLAHISSETQGTVSAWVGMEMLVVTGHDLGPSEPL